MRVIFRTNLDVINESWPELHTPNVPRVGDLVRSDTMRKGIQLELEVYRVTWTSEYVSVELNLKHGLTVSGFEEWYENLTRG